MGQTGRQNATLSRLKRLKKQPYKIEFMLLNYDIIYYYNIIFVRCWFFTQNIIAEYS